MKNSICLLAALVVSAFALNANAQTMNQSLSDIAYDYEAYIGSPNVVWGFHFKVYRASGTPEWYGPFSSNELMVNWQFNQVNQGHADDWVATESYEGPRSVVDWRSPVTYDTRQQAEDAIAPYRQFGIWRTKIERVDAVRINRRRR